MRIEEAFRKILNAAYEKGCDIQQVCGCEYLYETNITGEWITYTEEEIIELATAI